MGFSGFGVFVWRIFQVQRQLFLGLLYLFDRFAACRNNLREFVKTHVILAPVREFSRSRAAPKIPFPGAQAGKPGKAANSIFSF